MENIETMKKLNSYFNFKKTGYMLLGVLLIIGNSCKKGDARPVLPPGSQESVRLMNHVDVGVPEANTRNVNSQVFTFGLKTVTKATSYNLSPLLEEIVNNGLLLAYYSPSLEGDWHPVPGVSKDGNFTITMAYSHNHDVTLPQSTVFIKLLTHADTPYPNAVVFRKFKVVAIPKMKIDDLSLTVSQLKALSYDELKEVIQIKD